MTSAISFTMPLILCALSIPLLGETVGWRRWLAIVVGFVGVLVIVRPGTEAFQPAAILSVLTAMFGALYALLTRKLAGVDATTTQQFYSRPRRDALRRAVRRWAAGPGPASPSAGWLLRLSAWRR